MSRSRSFFVSTLSATALLTPLLAVLLPASSLAVPTNSIAAPPRIENWVESRIRTLLLGDEKNASRNREIYLRHLEDGITIAESDFPADQRASLMMDWIERSFSARNLGWDPLSLLIRAHLKHFQWIVARSHPDRLEGYREISERLREMRTLLLENGGER